MLYERRYVMEKDTRDMMNFKVQVRGGAWTAEHTGMAIDSFRAFATRGFASQLCARFHIGATATFSIRLYSEDGAQRLAHLWCHKMEWLLQLWCAHDRDDAFRFEEDVVKM